VLIHPDRSRIVVPNRKVVGEILHNYGRIRQSEVKVGVAYEPDLPVQIAVRPWVSVTDYGMVAGELNVSLLAELRRRGVAIPYPQREVRLIGG
jgi:small conductance mechanosensitive channel